MKSISRRDLVTRVLEKQPRIRRKDIAEVVHYLIEAMTEYLVAGERIELRDFGAFSTKVRKPKKTLSIHTGKTVDVPATKVCVFKPGKALKEKVAQSFKDEQEKE